MAQKDNGPAEVLIDVDPAPAPEPAVMCGGWVLIDGVWSPAGEDEV